MLKKLMSLPTELYQNRKLVLSLAKNDFKTKYAGSYLGIFWAFIQPIVTIFVYWFVFGNIFQNGTDRGAPYVLWLVTGLVPWFFLQDGLVSGTSTFLEYNYLVKKVVFKISILPMVKILSAFFVHVFFLVFVLLLYVFYGMQVDFYYLQVIYYSFCMFCFMLAVSYITSSIVVFFRDLTQIINIVLQVGIWMTPIMWDFPDLGLAENGLVASLVKLNPMYYVVNGYRTTLIDKIGFWEYPSLTLYFWAVTAILFVIGILLFRKLKIHFADVL
ncbi:ABC transporter permease [Enterococcus sp. BWR-S5]|uniref:ABC transporter permease n=1 Tax=Enterococcus sp. BWR-S5 TaxID=2787714 RepID=UPI001921DE18|nr:ABC transporter permease [Enterococcus sp. BWR-S5]MBL1223878.1 ABC transporter permease [Enterococcus sp. BWR-S5]